MTKNHSAIHDLLIDKILIMPINEWERAVDMLIEADDVNLVTAESMMSYLSVTAGEFACYLGYRGAYGTGDHGHQRALEQAEKRRKVMRKANGFTCP